MADRDALDVFHVPHGECEHVDHATLKVVLGVVELGFRRADGHSIPVRESECVLSAGHATRLKCLCDLRQDQVIELKNESLRSKLTCCRRSG